MKTLSLLCLLAAGCILPASGQSSLVFDAGTSIDVSAGADICADVLTINGSYSGSGTRCGGPLPITLASFTVRQGPSGTGAVLEWRTVSEINNFGFTVQTMRAGDPAFADLGGAFVPGHGTTNAPNSYTHVITGEIQPHTSFRLKQSDFDGSTHYSESITMDLTGVAEAQPTGFGLLHNYPNPFNPSTEFTFSVARSGRATLIVYNVLGEEIATIFDGMTDPGNYYRVRFDGSGRASGVYYARLQSGSDHQLRKMILMK